MIFPPAGCTDLPTIRRRIDALHALWQQAISRLRRRLNPARRPRAAPRVIKRKMPKWHVKRAHHAQYPQPTREPDYHIMALN